MFRPQGNCPNLDNFRRGEAGPDGGPSGNSYKAYPSRFRPCLSGCVPCRVARFSQGRTSPGQGRRRLPTFREESDRANRPRPYGNVTCPPGWRRPRWSIQANTVPWTARIAPGANVLLRTSSGPAAGNPAAMRQPVRLHRPRGNPPFQVAGYVRRRRCNGRQVEDRPTLGTKPPERKRFRSGGAHRVTQPY